MGEGNAVQWDMRDRNSINDFNLSDVFFDIVFLLLIKSFLEWNHQGS